MKFKLIDISKWERREYYEHYTSEVICSYSMTVVGNGSDIEIYVYM